MPRDCGGRSVRGRRGWGAERGGPDASNGEVRRTSAPRGAARPAAELVLQVVVEGPWAPGGCGRVCLWGLAFPLETRWGKWQSVPSNHLSIEFRRCFSVTFPEC